MGIAKALPLHPLVVSLNALLLAESPSIRSNRVVGGLYQDLARGKLLMNLVDFSLDTSTIRSHYPVSEICTYYFEVG